MGRQLELLFFGVHSKEIIVRLLTLYMKIN